MFEAVLVLALANAAPPAPDFRHATTSIPGGVAASLDPQFFSTEREPLILEYIGPDALPVEPENAAGKPRRPQFHTDPQARAAIIARRWQWFADHALPQRSGARITVNQSDAEFF